MSNPYPISRESRQTEVLVASAAQTVFGPTAYQVWDIEDVVVAVKPLGGEWDFVTVGLTIAKISSDILEKVTLTFDVGLGAGDLVQITSARVHERKGSVTQGGTINSPNLERELSRLATVIQELRRDVDNTPAFLPGDDGLSVKGYRLKNLVAGVAATDGANLGQVAALAAFGFVWVGLWGGNTEFAKNALTGNIGVTYICTVPHTKSANTEPGVGVDWETVFDVLVSAEAAGDFKSNGTVAMIADLPMGGFNLINVGLVDGRNLADDGNRLDSFSGNLSSLSLPGGTVISTFAKSLVAGISARAVRVILGVEDSWRSKSIGQAFPLLDHIPGVAVPPTDQDYRFVLLSAGQSGSGEYNQGAVNNEASSGVSPNIDATFDIDFAASPVHGQTFRCINTTGEFVRPGVLSGVLQASQNLAHVHNISGGILGVAGASRHVPGNDVDAIVSKPSGGDEARPRNESARYYMRIF